MSEKSQDDRHEPGASPVRGSADAQSGRKSAGGREAAKGGVASRLATGNKQGTGVPRRRSLILALIVVLLVVAGAAGGGAWWLWQRLQLSEQAARSQHQQLEGALIALGRRQQADQQQQAVQLQALRTREEADRVALQALRAQQGRGRRAWQVAEAEYLVRIASNRLQLERDVGTALSALGSADVLLHATGDPALLGARKALAGDIQALRSTPRPDVPGMSMAISGVVGVIDTLPLTGVTSFPGTNGQSRGAQSAVLTHGTGWRGMAQRVWDTLKTLVVIRRHTRAVRPLLPPEQRYFLTGNLHLILEQARLALLNEDNVDFHRRLVVARTWIGTYFDTEAPATRGVLETLADLQKHDIRPALPSVANALKAIERYRAAHRAGAGGRTPGSSQSDRSTDRSQGTRPS